MAPGKQKVMGKGTPPQGKGKRKLQKELIIMKDPLEVQTSSENVTLNDP